MGGIFRPDPSLANVVDMEVADNPKYPGQEIR
jgi:hypothetical protein